jgi:glutamyl-tRNA reductase
MIFYCIGIDCKSSPLEERGRAYHLRDEIGEFFKARTFESAVLFTCNRVEIYVLDCDGVSMFKALQVFRREFGDIFKNAYIKQGLSEVALHALRLASGLQSQIVPEEQILIQLKAWVNQEGFAPGIGKLWVSVLDKVSYIRSVSNLYKHQTNIARVVLADISKKLKPKKHKSILIVGTGKIAQLFAQNTSKNITLSFAARKKHSRAMRLAAACCGQVVSFNDIPHALRDVDALISATSSPHYVIKDASVFRFVKNNKFLVYDLAVPRDIKKEALAVNNIKSYDIDSISSFLTKRNQAINPYYKFTEKLISESIIAIEAVVNEYINKNGNQAFAACT